MSSKLGFHVDVITNETKEAQIVEAQPAVVKVIQKIEMVQRLYQQCPNTTFIMRHWECGDDFSAFGGVANPVGKAAEWMARFRPLLKKLPKERVYWESFNEPHSVTAPYGQFEAERQRLMGEEGYHACIGNFSVGVPNIEGDGDEWPGFYPALEMAHKYNNILGLHEYGGLFMAMWYGDNLDQKWREQRARGEQPTVDLFPGYEEGWLFGRYRKVWRQHIKPNGWKNIRIAITEFGLDRVGIPGAELIGGPGTMVSSYKGMGGTWARLFPGEYNGENEFYLKMLKWCDGQMQLDPYMVGSAIFTWGAANAAQWGEFDITGPVADAVIAHIKAGKGKPMPAPHDPTDLPGDTTAPPAEPDPEPEPDPGEDDPGEDDGEVIQPRRPVTPDFEPTPPATVAPLTPAIPVDTFPTAEAALASLVDKYQLLSKTHEHNFSRTMLQYGAKDLAGLLRAKHKANLPPGVTPAVALSALLEKWRGSAAVHPDAASTRVLQFMIYEAALVRARFYGGAMPEDLDWMTPPPPPQEPVEPEEPELVEPGQPESSIFGKPVSGHGLKAGFRTLRTRAAVNERIEFYFVVTNPTDETITLGFAGAAIYNEAGNNVGFHTSWRQWVLDPGQSMEWTDGTTIGTPGTYRLMFAFCLPGIDECQAGRGVWYEPLPPSTVEVR